MVSTRLWKEGKSKELLVSSCINIFYNSFYHSSATVAMPVSKSEVTQRKVESATETASSVGSAPSQTVSAVVSKLEKVSSPEAPKKKEKKQDLSGLPLASKKRRAIAGCKRADLRKEAMMGSESKCTESVMSGNYGPMIDLLEYE